MPFFSEDNRHHSLVSDNSGCVATKGTRHVFKESEDEKIRRLVGQYGENNWNQIAKQLPGRSARQCRERWTSYLAPQVVNGRWSKAENKLLLDKFREIGHQWKKLEAYFPGRSNINIKNHWHQIQRGLSHAEQPKQSADPLVVFDRLFSALMSEAENRSSCELASHFSSFEMLV
jgi:hypothetical protein